jgi:predicted Zn-dependent peptidase
MLDRSQPPVYKSIRNVQITRAESQTLTNGIKLHWLNAGEQPVIRLECVFKASNWQESQKGVSYFTIKMLNEGTSNRTAQQINEFADQFGAFLEFNHGVDRVNLTLYTVSKHLEKLLPLVLDMLTDSIFPEKELQNLKTITAQNIKVNSEKTAFLAQNKFKELVFGEMHPYGRNINPENIHGIDSAKLKAFFQTFILNQAFDVILSGHITDALLGTVQKAFESLQTNLHTPAAALISSTASLPKSWVIEKTDTLQSSIRVGKKMPTRKHPDYFKLDVLNEILGGYFGSRLMKNIREEKGFTYGISSNLATLNQEGYLVIGTDVKKEVTIQTLEEIYKEIEVLKTEPVGQEELETVQNFLIGSFVGNLTTPFALADHFRYIYFDGLGYEFYDHYIDQILHTTSQDLLELANKYFDRDSFVEVVAGGKA